ncbi:hypothetical protein F5X96DRAFT_675231 [Biscogniauxia mediterranea]|nr:hypothetical protein F5X96DRAFT_675231 [Biscogniauxia mediterranea]
MAPPTKKTTTTSLLYLTAIIIIIILSLTGPTTALLETCPHNLLHALTNDNNHKAGSTPCECAAVLAAATLLSTAFWAATTTGVTLLLPGTRRPSVGVGALVHAVLCALVVVLVRGGHREPGDCCARFYVGGPMTLLVGGAGLACAVLHAEVIAFDLTKGL